MVTYEQAVAFWCELIKEGYCAGFIRHFFPGEIPNKDFFEVTFGDYQNCPAKRSCHNTTFLAVALLREIADALEKGPKKK